MENKATLSNAQKANEDILAFEVMKACMPKVLDAWLSKDVSRKPKYTVEWAKTLDSPSMHLFWGGNCSQWAHTPFEIDGVTYPTSEHWMMAKKAEMFDDKDALAEILATKDPRTAKRIGRGVKNFDVATWAKESYGIVRKGNIEKFSQNDDLRAWLCSIEDTLIVEASPVDIIWGIGMSESDPNVKDVNNWKGQNLLGFAIMEVRMGFLKFDQANKRFAKEAEEKEKIDLTQKSSNSK